METNLNACIAAGWIRIDRSNLAFETFVGIAASGQEVEIGHSFDMVAVERYLTENPTPECW